MPTPVMCATCGLDVASFRVERDGQIYCRAYCAHQAERSQARGGRGQAERGAGVTLLRQRGEDGENPRRRRVVPRPLRGDHGRRPRWPSGRMRLSHGIKLGFERDELANDPFEFSGKVGIAQHGPGRIAPSRPGSMGQAEGAGVRVSRRRPFRLCRAHRPCAWWVGARSSRALSAGATWPVRHTCRRLGTHLPARSAACTGGTSSSTLQREGTGHRSCTPWRARIAPSGAGSMARSAVP